MNVPENLKYTKDHEWARIEGKTAVVGITDHAQSELGDIVFAELPPIGKEFDQLQEFGVVESVKTVSNLYCPLSGKVIERNDVLLKDPSLVNQDPYGRGWLIKLEIREGSETDALLSPEQYKELI